MINARIDFGHGRFQLWYLRDREKREVDALITKGRKPWCLVEAKRSDADPSPSLSEPRFQKTRNIHPI